MVSFTDKLLLCLGSSVIFFILNTEGMYITTQTVTGLTIYDFKTKCYNILGLLIHIIIFFVFTYLGMLGSSIDEGFKTKHLIYSTILFCLISTKGLQNILTIIFGDKLSSLRGCPNVYGVSVAATIYMLILIILLTVT